MAVDQRVLLLKSGNDIDISRVNADLMSYNQHENYEALVVNGRNERYLDFGESNAFVLTNALYGDVVCLTDRFGGEYTEQEPDIPLTETPEQEDSFPPPRLRKDFPETWFFSEYDVKDNEVVIVNPVVPDSMTSWIITGFAIHPEFGLGLFDPQELTVSEPFFITLNLPYSIKYDEVLKVSVSIHNYIDEKQKVSVTMFNRVNEFEFVTIQASAGKCNIKPSAMQGSQKKTVTVEANSVTSTFFMIKPKVAGRDIELRVKATTKINSDEVLRRLLVQHKGITFYNNKPMLIDLRRNSTFNYNFDINMPNDTVQGSIKIEATAVGDMLGPLYDIASSASKLL